MEWLARDSAAVDVTLSLDELLFIHQALNEVCNGIHIYDAEFETRLGFRREDGRALLAQLGNAWRSVEGAHLDARSTSTPMRRA
jgi:hypothetical protein